MRDAFRIRLGWLLAAFALAAVVASVLVGSESLSAAQAWREWRAGIPLPEAPTLSVFINQRMPRTLTALLAGAGLALAGCSFQALLRNPLATPYTLGVASAGSLGAYVAHVFALGTSVTFLSFGTVQAFAFAFAVADVLLIYGLAVRKSRVSPTVLLLAGVTLNMLAGSGIMFMRHLARPEHLVTMERWLMGGVDVIGFDPVLVLLLSVTPCAVVLLAQAAKFDQLGFGAELAAGRGVNVKRLQAVTFVVGSLMTAVIVSEVGPIGFVGLITPHAVRTFVGSRHRILMPLSLLAGAGFLCCCDIVARVMLPGETPIGIVTSLIGGPFFIYLLVRRKFAD